MTSELLRIEFGLERLLWHDPDQNQLDVWDVTLQTGELDEQAATETLAAIRRGLSH